MAAAWPFGAGGFGRLPGAPPIIMGFYIGAILGIPIMLFIMLNIACCYCSGVMAAAWPFGAGGFGRLPGAPPIIMGFYIGAILGIPIMLFIMLNIA